MTSPLTSFNDPVCKALSGNRKSQACPHLERQQLAHDLARGAAHAVHKRRKVVQVRLVQRVAHDLNLCELMKAWWFGG